MELITIISVFKVIFFIVLILWEVFLMMITPEDDVGYFNKVNKCIRDIIIYILIISLFGDIMLKYLFVSVLQAPTFIDEIHFSVYCFSIYSSYWFLYCFIKCLIKLITRIVLICKMVCRKIKKRGE